ncbi:MAG TPA: prolyl oligopeptidase family serine peptidase [Chloroflexota bacterium]|nr:prolyl oligopeptidase family serine peptidase [Chloroflexota bacterium]
MWPVGIREAWLGRGRRGARRGAGIIAALLAVALLWLATTGDVRVWPVRNTLQYKLFTFWWTITGTAVDWDPNAIIDRGKRTGTLQPNAAEPALAAGVGLTLGDPEVVTSQTPLPGRAVRRSVSFQSGGRSNQLTLLYTPEWVPLGAVLPVLLTVYPGPADGWEAASVPLAEAGYAVIAVGPAYSFALERDIDELARLLRFAREGRLPGADGSRLAVLGGSYSGLHVLRLLQREHGQMDLRAVVLMGAPTDLFDMRRRLEDRSFVPPFGLDQALIALGIPNRNPARYWRYSGAYHVRPKAPPHLLIHSRSDDVVPYQQSELLARSLAGAGVPHELHLMDGGSHYLLSNETEARLVQELTLEFLRRYLAG